jgi:tripartite ATP-independent transporter DctM subunit
MTALVMFLVVIGVMLAGFPVAFTLAGTALAFALAGTVAGTFDTAFLGTMPARVFGIMGNETLVAVPLFVFMGVMLERARIAEDLLDTLGLLLGRLRGGLAVAVTLVGMLLAASTGIVGATVVTMGLLSLPTMLKRGYDPAVATGIISASGTLGQIIPPSIILVLLGDVLGSAYQQAQLSQGVFRPDAVSVGVASPAMMEPSTATISSSGGSSAFITRRASPAAPPSAGRPGGSAAGRSTDSNNSQAI